MHTSLKQALQNGQTLLACNFYNLETLQGVLQAAAEMQRPIILQLTASSIEYMGLQTAVNMARTAIKEAGAQAWLHLDHAASPELVLRCLEAGFDSVMIDASDRPFEENLAVTQKVVAMARPFGALVEAELGYVAKLGQSTEKTGFTEPHEAAQFVEQSGVDLLAVAIGSAHGFYKQTPRLDIERLKAIRQATPAALVLHGSSGIPVEQIRAAINAGIQKINLATEIKNIFMQTLKKTLKTTDEIDLRKVFPAARQEVTQLVKNKMEALDL
ncbi:class II fructose-bisphosphate aldolase [Caldithrix abyssi]|uniref:Fructose-bisphosphate aldolase n=1 Tax=Caldithrix abyssi DSM 13497 TaxID=880073 RepID=H1XRF7_CALAY|nr:class II fructose-bisphosphate aldolase [Caldithrix abyssi]APF18432.1 fructose-bisphosphate aldolase [Caldithrix abyssi DSM 13497]EHO42438.1 ketose-bisphosphate aldolase class-II [Caldithrix abyssi DSM 13497]